MTAKEFADIYGKDGSWAQRMAKKAVRQGKSYPVKRGNYWFATRSQWEAILKESGIRLRNRKKGGEGASADFGAITPLNGK